MRSTPADPSTILAEAVTAAHKEVAGPATSASRQTGNSAAFATSQGAQHSTHTIFLPAAKDICLQVFHDEGAEAAGNVPTGKGDVDLA